MIFHIADSIIFNGLDGTLKPEYEVEGLKLSLTATKLLLVLLESQGEVCGREFLLSAVWDNEGLIGSNGNLNQYISILRKSFGELGLSDFIITVPRTGFRLNNSVIIVREDNSTDLKPNPVSHFTKSKLGIYTTSLALVILTAILFFYKKQDQVKQENITYQGCNITYLSQYSKEEVANLNSRVLRILTKKGLKCDPSKIIYFDHHSSVNIKDLGRSLLSVCQKGSDHRVMKCDNFYYYNLKADG